jgi:septal ring factor EnvC (AmiA/AmiB activator)
VSRSSRRFTVIALASVVSLMPGPRAVGQDAQRRASERLRTLREESDALAGREKSLLVDLRRLEVERDIRAELQRDAQAALAAANQELVATAAQLGALEVRQTSQVPGLATRLAELYKLGSGGYLRLLLSVNDVRDMGRAYRTVGALAAIDRERVRQHASTVASLRQTRADLKTRRERAAALEAEARRASAEAAAAVQARSALISEIDARRDLNAQLAGELQSAQQKLTATVSSLTTAGSGLPIRPFQGALEWPVTGRVIARFGRGSTSRFGTEITRSGIEIASPLRRAVAAVHEGTVAYAAPFTGFGNLVILDHGAQTYTLYGYLSAIAASKGARIEKGARVGDVGVSPTGQAVLYFELRVDGKAVDPLQWLKPRF